MGIVLRYQQRSSGPLLDRIDIYLDVPRVAYNDLVSMQKGELSTAIWARVEAAMQQMNLSARGYQSILKLARTIDDLADCDQIVISHLAEALQYRSKVVEG